MSIATVVDGQVVILDRSCIGEYATRASKEFPEFAQIVQIIGYDWMGRPIGTGKDQQGEGDFVYVYDAIFDELLAFEAKGPDPLNSPLFDPSSDNFGHQEFRKFLVNNRLQSLPEGKCAGFNVPPQFGGEVSASNMEVYDVFSYWHYIAILQQIDQALPTGTILRSIVLD